MIKIIWGKINPDRGTVSGLRQRVTAEAQNALLAGEYGSIHQIPYRNRLISVKACVAAVIFKAVVRNVNGYGKCIVPQGGVFNTYLYHLRHGAAPGRD